ncbi:MAG: hypothetical protein IKN79_06465 [Eubacterium sp.]|nr:hypothetical protein [Eubacterium sp.]
MKSYTFPTGGSFGGGDSWEGIFDYELSNRDAKRLEDSARKEPREWLEDDPEIADIMEKVTRAAYRENIRVLVGDKSFVAEQREWYEDETGKKGHADSTIIKWYMEGTSFSVKYPEELQNLEPTTAYTFCWQCDGASGELELELTDEEVELIKDAYRDAFAYLEECSDLDEIRERAVQQLDFYDPELEQDIRIYFPEVIIKEVDEEDEE